MQPFLFGPDPEPADPCGGDDSGLSLGGWPGRGVSLADARPYQIEWRDLVLQCWARTARCLGVAATGTGKTMAVAMISRAVLDGALDAVCPGNRRAVLFVNQRVELVRQAAREFTGLLPGVHVGIEQGETTARGPEGVVSACLQSLSARRLAAMGRGRFQAVVYDEAHRYGPRNKGLRRLREYFGPAVRELGVTATPDRTDGKLGAVFNEVAFSYDIWKAVEDGYLVRPHMAYEASGAVRLDGLPVDADGDFSADALAARMCEAGPVAAVVAAAIKWSNYANKRDGRRPTVICCASVDQAKLVALMLNEWHRKENTGAAGAVVGDGDMAVRKAVLDGFRRGDIQYVTHFDVLTEGFDSELPKVLVNGRPTKCRWVFAQNGGRVLRPLKEVARLLGTVADAASRRAMIAGSTKPGAMIVDVAGTDHKLAVCLADVFHPPGVTPADVDEVRERARTRAERGEAADPAADYAALRRAREAARAKEWSGIMVDADLTTRFADPFDVQDVVPGREPPWVRGRRPTAKMKTMLINAGLPKPDVDRMTFWAAKRRCDLIVKRREAGLCSYKQARLLMKFGIDPDLMSFVEAGAEINRLAASGWRRPPEAAGV